VDLETLTSSPARESSHDPLSSPGRRSAAPMRLQDVASGTIDPATAYVCRLASGRSIALFFYDGQLAHDVAFDSLLARGENLAERILSRFPDDNSQPGSSTLPPTARRTATSPPRGHGAGLRPQPRRVARDVRLTVYGEYLEPPPADRGGRGDDDPRGAATTVVRPVVRTADATPGGQSGWEPAVGASLSGMPWTGFGDCWRRSSEREGAALSRIPGLAREEYVQLILDRSVDDMKSFLPSCRPPAESR